MKAEDLELIKTIAAVVAAVVAILVAIGFFKWFPAWVQKKWDHYKAGRDAYRNAMAEIMRSINEDLKGIKNDMSLVKGQVFPNGGTSLNDKVTKGFSEMLTGQRNTREIMDIATWESDDNGSFYYVSSALCDLIGCTQSDLLDNSWIGTIRSEDRDRVVKEWLDSLKNASQFDSTFDYKKSDGYYQKVRGVAIHNKDEKGKVSSTLGRIIKIGEPYKK